MLNRSSNVFKSIFAMRRFSSDPCARCPSCQGCFKFGQQSFFCPKCSELKEAGHTHELDFFSLLGINKQFTVDIKQAELKYRNLQKIVHPDHLGATNDYCALLNQAIAVIKSPLLRASHLLQLHGHKLPQESDRVKDKSLLAEVMEFSDSIDDADGDRNELDNLLISVQQKKTECQDIMTNAYNKQDLDAFAAICERLRFLERIEERLNNLLRL